MLLGAHIDNSPIRCRGTIATIEIVHCPCILLTYPILLLNSHHSARETTKQITNRKHHQMPASVSCVRKSRPRAWRFATCPDAAV